jgi:replicative superfamily II helicase
MIGRPFLFINHKRTHNMLEQQHIQIFSTPYIHSESSQKLPGTRNAEKECYRAQKEDECLVPTSKIAGGLSEFFSFKYFNKMQSQCFQRLYEHNGNTVISSPTASGKTALFEIAMCRVFNNKEKSENDKVIYVGPTKALCQERMDDWSKRLSKFGIVCIEVTGDTDEVSINVLENAHVIITTPEKWDSFTRKW